MWTFWRLKARAGRASASPRTHYQRPTADLANIEKAPEASRTGNNRIAANGLM